VLAVRTTTSALWRPAARQDWVAARAAFEEADRAKRERRDVAYVNELGTPTRAVDLDELVASAGTYGLLLERWYGVRIAVDPDELDPPPPDDPGTLSDLIDVEERLGATDPFRHLGQLALVVFRA
jgi:S-adenosylmethionine-dependent methyltransferase